MGIPRLTSYFSPYAITTVLGCDQPVCKEHSHSITHQSNKIIIDGPAFAYTVYDRLVARGLGQLDTLAAVPSYNEVGNAALTFLSELKKRGSTIEKIYFDGFLPPEKTKTRIARLNYQIQRLSAFYSLHQHGFANVFRNVEAHAINTSGILDAKRTKSTLGVLPAAPFFVAAVLEATKSSGYASVTEVVPGEADAYCAATARQNGGTILSNDSDLLIHDLGPNGAVGSLNQLEVVTQGDGNAKGDCTAIQTTVVKPREVAQSLGLKDLKGLAYVLKRDSTVAFPKAVQQAQNIKISGSEFQQKLGEYVIEPAAFESSMFRQDTIARIRTQAPFLDPRISELVLKSDKESASFYLPIMIEDPNRTSAFAVSDSQRILAYSCCSLPYKVQDREILEYSRKGPNIAPTSIDLLSEVEIIQHAKCLRKRFQHFKTVLAAFPAALIWRAYALTEVYHWYLNTFKIPPSRDSIIAAMAGKATGRVTWDDIHLCAQIEACLYSLRMIQQVLGFVLPFTPSGETKKSVTGILTELTEDLEYLPPLKHLMPSRWELLAQAEDLDVDELLNAAATIIQEDIHQEELGNGAN